MNKTLTESEKNHIIQSLNQEIEDHDDWTDTHARFGFLVGKFSERKDLPERPIPDKYASSKELKAFAKKLAVYEKLIVEKDLKAEFAEQYLLQTIKQDIIKEKRSDRLSDQMNADIFDHVMSAHSDEGYHRVAEAMEDTVALIHKALDDKSSA